MEKLKKNITKARKNEATINILYDASNYSIRVRNIKKMME
ncbi:MAG: hypothetical protein ACI8ZF_000718 [Candidatus Midichloriaceae bacterium]|jgi:hypothetical protein